MNCRHADDSSTNREGRRPSQISLRKSAGRAAWWVVLVIASGCAEGSSPARLDVGSAAGMDATSPTMKADASAADAEVAVELGDVGVASDAGVEDADDEDAEDAQSPDAIIDGGALDAVVAEPDATPDAAIVCPRERPAEQSGCREAEDGMQCYYLEQCCCGRCYPQDVCVCVSSGGGYVWSCGFLDVCPAVCEPPSDAGVTD